MIDYYLRTETEEEMLAAFSAIGILLPAGENLDGRVVYLNGVRMDIGWVGPIFDPQNELGLMPMLQDDRFHVNLRVAGDLPEETLAALPIMNPPPATPMRVWA
jgi:hypothetical protein